MTEGCHATPVSRSPWALKLSLVVQAPIQREQHMVGVLPGGRAAVNGVPQPGVVKTDDDVARFPQRALRLIADGLDHFSSSFSLRR